MLINSSTYATSGYLRNGHLNTLWAAFLRPKIQVERIRKRITTPDQDFLDLDYYRQGSNSLVILNHGLEGNSASGYMLGMTQAFLDDHYDVLAWNYRSCSGEMNKQPRFYHSGETGDLDFIISRELAGTYDSIYLIGFSLGGNVILKYLGELGTKALKKGIRGAVAFSAPVHLASSCEKVSHGLSYLYTVWFLYHLRKKIVEKERILPDVITRKHLKKIRTLRDFDDYYTGPLHGFKDAKEYYELNSSLGFLENISVPTLLINARNDPMLSDLCYPIKILRDHPHVHLEIPEVGGHVGFVEKSPENFYWSEYRAVSFIRSL